MRPPRFMYRKLQRIEVANLDFIRFCSSCRPCRPQRHPNANTFLAMLLLTAQYAAKNPVLAGKVTCGVRNETSGQSWPSNTFATDPFTGQTGIQSVAAVSSTNVWAVGGQRLCTFRFKRFVTLGWQRSSLELLTFLPNQPRQRPFNSCDGRGVGALASNCPIAVRKPGPVER